jgi:hypothetical protein
LKLRFTPLTSFQCERLADVGLGVGFSALFGPSFYSGDRDVWRREGGFSAVFVCALPLGVGKASNSQDGTVWAQGSTCGTFIKIAFSRHCSHQRFICCDRWLSADVPWSRTSSPGLVHTYIRKTAFAQQDLQNRNRTTESNRHAKTF